MPGKHDFSAGGAVGQYAPGAKEFRAWDEGWRAKYAGDLIGTNPFDQTALPAEYAAWNDGWNEAAGNSTGVCRMPAICGVPPS